VVGLLFSKEWRESAMSEYILWAEFIIAAVALLVILVRRKGRPRVEPRMGRFHPYPRDPKLGPPIPPSELGGSLPCRERARDE